MEVSARYFAACCIAAKSYKPDGLLVTICRFWAAPATTSYRMATRPLWRLVWAASGIALAGKDSPGGNLAARHSGELKGSFALSTDCAGPSSAIFVELQAVTKTLASKSRKGVEVFIGARNMRNVLGRPNVRAKLAPTAWRVGQQAQNGPQAQRLMASATFRWGSA